MNSAVVGVKRRKGECSKVIKFLELYAWHEHQLMKAGIVIMVNWYFTRPTPKRKLTYIKLEQRHIINTVIFVCGLMSKQE